MTEHTAEPETQDGSGPRPEPPRLLPRPLDRPEVDAERPRPRSGGRTASKGRSRFRRTDRRTARPSGARRAPGRARDRLRQADAAVAPLQRPPGPERANGKGESPFWDPGAAGDPWRNPDSTVGLGPPAGTIPPDTPSARAPGARLSLREVVFGGRVHPLALAALAVIALLVGAVGGVVGRLTAEDASRLTSPDPTITQAVAAKERPAGSVADIAARTVPAVVSVEVKVGEQGGTGSGVVDRPRRVRDDQQPRRRPGRRQRRQRASPRSSTTARGCPPASSAGTPRPISP